MQASLASVPFTARHCLLDYFTLNFKNEMSMSAVFLDIGEAFDTTWHLSRLYKLSELKFR
jgi:hypothetical protein